MKNLVKEVPATIKFDTEVIKKGSIYKIEDKLSCSIVNYIVECVTENELHISSLTRGLKLTLKPEDIGNKYAFISEMEIVEKKDNKFGQVTEDIKNKINENTKTNKPFNLNKEECEKATEDYNTRVKNMAKILRDMGINTYICN